MENKKLIRIFNSMLSKYTLFFLVFLVVVSLSVRKISNFDVHWHLKTGQYILENFSVPTHDIFSHTVPANEWIDHHWLFQTIIFGIYKLSGYPGLILFKTFLLLFAFIFIFQITHKKASDTLLVPIFILGIIAASGRFSVRPHIISFLSTSIFMYILYKYKYDKKDYLYVLPITQIFWANSASSEFILGVAIIWIFLLGEFITWKVKLPFYWNSKDVIKNKFYYKLLLIGAITLLACFVNPHGIKKMSHLLRQFLMIAQGTNVFKYIISEFQSPFAVRQISPFLSYKIILLVSLGSFILNVKKLSITNLMMFSVFSGLSFLALRNIPLFVFVALPITIKNLENTFAKSMSGKYLPLARIFLFFGMTFFVLAICTNKYYVLRNISKKFGLGLLKSEYPIEAVNFIRQNDIRGNIFNDLHSGSYLIWKLWPDKKVFIDNRLEVYGEQFFIFVINALTHFGKWDQLAQKYHIDCILLRHSFNPIRRLIHKLHQDKKWVCVHIDANYMIFLRDSHKNKDTVDSHRVNFKKLRFNEMWTEDISKNSPSGYMFNVPQVLISMGLFSEAIRIYKEIFTIYPNSQSAHFHLLEERAKLNPPDPTSQVLLAKFYYDVGKLDKAERNIKRVLLERPSSNYAKLLLGHIRFKQRLFVEAEKLYEEVLKYDQREITALINLGVINFKRGNAQEAINYFKMVLKIDPKNKFAFANAGIVYLQQKRHTLAINYLNEAAKIGPHDKNIQRYLESALNARRRHDNY